MKLTGKQIGIMATAGITGMFAGVLLISGGIRIQLLSLAGLLALPPIAVGLIVADTKAQGKVNQAEAKVSDALRSLDGATIKLAASEEKEASLQLELAEVQNSLNRAKELLRVCEVERCQSAATIGQQHVKIDELQAALVSHQERLEELEAEIEAWEEQFQATVNQEAQKLFQVAKLSQIKRIETENDALTREAIEIAKQYRQWANLADARLQDPREFVENITSSYNSKISDFGQSYSKQVSGYLEQIEILNCKVAALQQKLQGDLLQPEYGQFGYAVEGRISNDIARRFWEELQIPLAVKGYQVKPDGSTDVGYGYSRSIPVEALLRDFSRHSADLAKWLGIHKVTSIRKHEISDLIILTFRREPAVKDDTVRLIAGTADEFIAYVTSHPIRYRLIADPGQGKTPTTAVMVSEILKVGGTRGNTGKGKKIPHTLVTVSCPDVESSQKDSDYPLEIFLKYGNTTAAVKSIDDALEDWQYRKRDTVYAENFFQLWVWDELDNTLSSSSDPKGTGEAFKKILKQCHHTGVGWIVSGQSVMTSQIPGFMDDDRELFTQIIIGTSKIRKYLEKYGKKVLSAKAVSQLLRNLDDLEPYIEEKNSRVTDIARLLRLALILDDKSPKLYFLPNLDSVKFDGEKIENVITKAEQTKRHFLVQASGQFGQGLGGEVQNYYSEGIPKMGSHPPNLTIGVSTQFPKSTQKPHCPHCGGSTLELVENETRYQCESCKTASNRPKKFVVSKAIWK
jgi:hypothetical protein